MEAVEKTEHPQSVLFPSSKRKNKPPRLTLKTVQQTLQSEDKPLTESYSALTIKGCCCCCCCYVASVVSDSVQPQRRQPTRLPCPWDSPGKNTGVGCHLLLQCMKVKSESEVAQSCLTLSDPWTAAYQAPPSMGFSRQEYWSGVPLPLKRQAIINVDKDGVKRNLMHCWWEHKLVQPLWKTVCSKFFLNNSYDLAIPLWGFTWRNQNTNSKRYFYPVFITALFTIAKTWQQHKCSLMDEWVKKIWYICDIYTYIHNRILFSHIKEGALVTCDNMSGPWGH